MGFTLNQLEQERQIRKLQKKEDKDTSDYEQLSNLPKINNVELKGDKTTSDLGLQSELTFDNVPTDGSNNPVKSDGIYDSEKDIYAVMGQMGAKNLIPYPYYEGTETEAGITFTDNGDGTITISGTASAQSWHFLSKRNTDTTLYLQKGAYILSGAVTSAWLMLRNSDGIDIGHDIDGSGVTINVLSDDYYEIALVIVNGATVSGTVKPMLRLASDTDDTYQPYAKTNRELTESYPANKVMMSDGVTSVEEALDDIIPRTATGTTLETLNTALQALSEEQKSRATVCVNDIYWMRRGLSAVFASSTYIGSSGIFQMQLQFGGATPHFYNIRHDYGTTTHASTETAVTSWTLYYQGTPIS